MQSEIDMNKQLPPDNGEALLRQRMLEHEFPFDESAWAALEQQLDARAVETSAKAEVKTDHGVAPSGSPLPNTIVMMLSVFTVGLILWQTADLRTAHHKNNQLSDAHALALTYAPTSLATPIVSTNTANSNHSTQLTTEQASAISFTTTSSEPAVVSNQQSVTTRSIVDDHAPVVELSLPSEREITKQPFRANALSEDATPNSVSSVPAISVRKTDAPTLPQTGNVSGFSDDSMPVFNSVPTETVPSTQQGELMLKGADIPVETTPLERNFTRPATAPAQRLGAPQLLPVQPKLVPNLQRFRIPMAMPLAKTQPRKHNKNAISVYAGANVGVPNYQNPIELVPGFHVGASYFHAFNEKWGIQVELSGRRMSGYNNLRLNNSFITVEDPSSFTLNDVDAQIGGLYFIELPVLARFSPVNQRINWVFGVKPSINSSFDAVELTSGDLYENGILVGISSIDYSYDDTYFRQWLHDFDLNVVLGIEYPISSRFHLMARYQQGLRSLNWGAATVSSGQVFNTDFQVGIKARLF
jgi:Outer membrane protein beta-barrel domain